MKAYVIYDTTEHDLNLRYWGNFSAPDAFLALKLEDGRTLALVSELEYGRCKLVGTFDSVIALPELRKRLETEIKNQGYWSALFDYLHSEYKVAAFVLPYNFPAGIYEHIRFSNKFSVGFDDDFFKTQRAIKRSDEIVEIRKACNITVQTLTYVKRILSECEQQNGWLYYDGDVLTSERLRFLMEQYCLQCGGRGQDSIVACGQEAANPHSLGTGPLMAQQLIVVDFFPYLQSSHYYGDMTRTFFVGQPSVEEENLYNCVLECQRQVIARVRPGVSTRELMTFAVDFFDKHGYGIKKNADGYEGFIHSLGHGIGLDLHEFPSVGNCDITLQPGMVVTIEPGLYFRDIGGVRIEDDILITESGCEILTPCDYDWII